MAKGHTSSLIVRMPFPAKAVDSSAQPSRKKSRSTLWREKLKKENPDVYGELKKVDRQRKKREYDRELLDESMTTRYKRILKREKKATHQRQRRRKQRLAKQSKTTTEGSSSSITTNDGKDNEITKKERRNKYMKEYMCKKRASMSLQKKQAVKEKDKQRKTLASTKQSGTASTSSNGSMKVDRKRKECQPCLPDTPERFADVIGSVLDTSTPKEIKASEERGISATEEGRKGFSLMNRFGEETKKLSESCKKKKTSASKIVRRSLNQTIANIVRKKYGYANAKGGKHHS